MPARSSPWTSRRRPSKRRRFCSCLGSTALNVVRPGTQARSSRSGAFSCRDALATRTGSVVDTALIVTGIGAETGYRAFRTLRSIPAGSPTTRAGARLPASEITKIINERKVGYIGTNVKLSPAAFTTVAMTNRRQTLLVKLRMSRAVADHFVSLYETVCSDATKF